jgi:hypothetical protein
LFLRNESNLVETEKKQIQQFFGEAEKKVVNKMLALYENKKTQCEWKEMRK